LVTVSSVQLRVPLLVLLELVLLLVLLELVLLLELLLDDEPPVPPAPPAPPVPPPQPTDHAMHASPTVNEPMMSLCIL
jgi:hypothetical protein